MSALHPLVAEAMKKAAIAWITIGERPGFPVWCLWADAALYVVSGPGEQTAPGLPSASTVTVSARGDHGGRIVSWRARVERIHPDTDTWNTVVPQLTSKRLNSSTGAEHTAARWASECWVGRLVPLDEEPQAGVALPDSSLAAPPIPTPAARPTRRPFRLHRVRPPAKPD